jgi:hypothetical protein
MHHPFAYCVAADKGDIFMAYVLKLNVIFDSLQGFFWTSLAVWEFIAITAAAGKSSITVYLCFNVPILCCFETNETGKCFCNDRRDNICINNRNICVGCWTLRSSSSTNNVHLSISGLFFHIFTSGMLLTSVTSHFIELLNHVLHTLLGNRQVFTSSLSIVLWL